VPCLLDYWDAVFPNDVKLISPFFGGGSFEIALLEQKRVSHVYANDLDYRLIDFWKSAKTRSASFVSEVNKLGKGKVTKARFIKIRQEIRDDERRMVESKSKRSVYTQSELGARYWILNQISFSGLGMSGGYSAERMEKFARKPSKMPAPLPALRHITFTCMDWEQFLDKMLATRDRYTVLYLDPPYYFGDKVPSMYGTNGSLIRGFDHERLAQKLSTIDGWMLSYNNSSVIKRLYKDYTQYTCQWQYSITMSSKDRADKGRKRELVIMCPLNR
jgi:site-specific DNA-adenine methylase